MSDNPLGLKRYEPYHIQYDEFDSSTTMDEDELGGWVSIEDVSAKITSGELMVVKMATLIRQSSLPNDPGMMCSACHQWTGGRDGKMLEVGEFCRCGAKIIG